MLARRVFIRDTYFKITEKPSSNCYGHCLKDYLKPQRSYIYFPTNGGSTNDLATIIHEFTHAFFWQLNENHVESIDEYLSNVLWHMGIRKANKTKWVKLEDFIENDLSVVIYLAVNNTYTLRDFSPNLLQQYCEELAELLFDLNWFKYRMPKNKSFFKNDK